jgi:AraC family transcriptional regulator
MNPKIISKPELLVVGMNFYGDPFQQASAWEEENQIGLLWKRFMALLQQNPSAIKHIAVPDVALEIHLYSKETQAKGLFDVFVGIMVEKLEDVPLECTVKLLPATQYAVFTLKGRQITGDWGKEIYGEWLPSSGYSTPYNFMIQYYDSRFKGLDKLEDSLLDVYIPVKRDQ